MAEQRAAGMVFSTEETIALIRQKAKETNKNSFRIRIMRRKSQASLSDSVALLDEATVEQIAYPETWLGGLCGGSGPSGSFFTLQAYHTDENHSPIGGPLVYPATGEPKTIDPAIFTVSDWPGPKLLISAEGMTPAQLSAKAAAARQGDPFGAINAFTINGGARLPVPPSFPNGGFGDFGQAQAQAQATADQQRWAQFQASRPGQPQQGLSGISEAAHYEQIRARDAQIAALVAANDRARDLAAQDAKLAALRDQMQMQAQQAQQAQRLAVPPPTPVGPPPEPLANVIAAVIAGIAPLVTQMMSAARETRAAEMKAQEERAAIERQAARDFAASQGESNKMLLAAILQKKEDNGSSAVITQMADGMSAMMNTSMQVLQTATELQMASRGEPEGEGIAVIRELGRGVMTMMANSQRVAQQAIRPPTRGPGNGLGTAPTGPDAALPPAPPPRKKVTPPAKVEQIAKPIPVPPSSIKPQPQAAKPSPSPSPSPSPKQQPSAPIPAATQKPGFAGVDVGAAPADAKPEEPEPAQALQPEVMEAEAAEAADDDVTDENTIDVIEDMIRAYEDPIVIATYINDAVEAQDSDMMEALEQANGSFQEIFAERLGEWIEEDPANIEFTQTLFENVIAIGMERGLMEGPPS